MLMKEVFFSMASLEGLETFEASLSSTYHALKMHTAEELIRFAKINNIKSIFYQFEYYDEKGFLISEEHTEKVSKDVLKIVAEEIRAYNKRILSIDFSRPRNMNIFCIYEGQIIYVNYSDAWAEKDGLILPGEKLQQLIENNKEIKYMQEEKRRDDELLLLELRQYILRDPEFARQTYPGFRRDYIRGVFAQRKETQKFRHLLFSENDYDYVDMKKAVDFIESLWRELKG